MKAIRNKDIDQAVKVMREVMAGGKDSDRLAAAKLLLTVLVPSWRQTCLNG